MRDVLIGVRTFGLVSNIANGPVPDTARPLLTEGALRRVVGLDLAGVVGDEGDGGPMAPFTTGATPAALEMDADLPRRDRGIFSSRR